MWGKARAAAGGEGNKSEGASEDGSNTDGGREDKAEVEEVEEGARVIVGERERRARAGSSVRLAWRANWGPSLIGGASEGRAVVEEIAAEEEWKEEEGW